MKFSKFYINIFSFAITLVIIVLVISLFFGTYKVINKISNDALENNKEDSSKQELEKEINNIPSNEIKEWNIKIDSIKLNQNIKEGIDNKVINSGIGHYSYTDNLKSNICLLGKSVFEKISEVRVNDVIDYKINNNVKHYKVRKNIIIDKIEVNEYINTFEDKNLLKLFGIIKVNENKIRYVEAVEFN